MAALLFTGNVVGQAGGLDPSFSSGAGANGEVKVMTVQKDGMQVLAGSFTEFQGSTANKLVRIQRNGQKDANFNVGSGPNGDVNAIAVNADGGVLVGGTFTSFDGSPAGRLVRLTSFGAVDAGFLIGTGFTGGSVNAIAIQSDGRMLMVGGFTQFNGVARSRVVRLRVDGSLDAMYSIGTGANGEIHACSLDGQGRLVIAGSFTSFNGTARPGLARLNTNGTLDLTFNPGAGPNGAVYTVTHQRNGRILIGGQFTSYGGSTPAPRIARLLSTGAFDASFNTGMGFNGTVRTIVLQGDEKHLVGGEFTSYNGLARGRMVRLNTSGSLDGSFVTGSAFNSRVNAITWQPEGRVTAAGGFTSFSGTTQNGLARLMTGCDDTLQLILSTDGAGHQTSWELVGEGYTYPLCGGSGYADNSTIELTCCVPNTCLRLVVYDEAGDGMTTGGYVLADQFGNRIIDNSNDGVFGSKSSIKDHATFCLPLSTDRVTSSVCDRTNLLPTDYMIAVAIPEVSAEWGVGTQTDDGYEFWFFDPDGTYSHRRFRSHATSDGFGTGATRACYQRLSWTSSVNSIPLGVKLNVRVRGRVNGVNNAWGPACMFMLDPSGGNCPVTKLLDAVGNRYHSCGVTRTRSQYVTAQPVTGANRYQFEFVNTQDGYYYVAEATTYHRYLNWASPALVAGRTYTVRVRVSLDGGAKWCSWGEPCTVTITSGMQSGEGSAALGQYGEDGGLSLWPNPTTGDLLQLQLENMAPGTKDLTLQIFDATGRVVHTQRTGTDDVQWRTTVQLPGSLPNGQYFVLVASGERTWNQRFVVAR